MTVEQLAAHYLSHEVPDLSDGVSTRTSAGTRFATACRTCSRSVALTSSLEEAARLSGMEVSEWMAIEDGCVPQDINRLRAMAETMQISFDKIATLVLVCRAAWEV